MAIHKSAEDYLETIYMESLKSGPVRSIDIANALNYSKPSVSIAMKSLEEQGYIRRDDGRLISLTEKGLAIAQEMYARHETLARCLMALGVSKAVAYEDACKIEHDLSEETFACLCRYAEQMGL